MSNSRPEESAPLTLPENEKKKKDLEEYIGLNWYTYLVFAASYLIILSTVNAIVNMVYSGATPTVRSCGNETFPMDPKLACERFHKLQENGDFCTPVLDYQFESLNVEFDLLCHDAVQVKSSISYQMFAVFIGTFIFGQFSDSFGRKKGLMIAEIGMLLFNFAVYFAPSFEAFVILRLFVCFFAGGTSAVHGVYIIEHTMKNHRMMVSNVVTWSPNFALAPVIAYYANDWRTLSLYSSYVNVAAIALLFFCYESPRFLVQKGEIDEAKRVLSAIRKINRDHCEVRGSEIDEMLERERELFLAKSSKKRYTYLDLFSSSDLCTYTLIIGIGVFITSLQNYGILFNSEKLSGSIYVNGALFGILRWVANIAIGIIDMHCAACTRKLVAAVGKGINLICLAIILIINYSEIENDHQFAIRVCSLTILIFCGPLYVTKFLTSSELYPTSVRNVGTSFQSMSSRLGTIFGSSIFILSETHKSIPYGVLIALLIMDVFLFQCIIPETKGRELLNDIEKKPKPSNA